jgi:capsule polysaccharide export protein KpsE/RkpR
MEIMKFLKLTPKRIAVVLVVALLAAIASVAFQSRRPPTWSGSATVFVSSVFRGSTFEVEPYLQNFITNITLTPVLIQTQQLVDGVTLERLEANLSADRPPNSSSAEVVYSGPTFDEVQQVLRTASQVAMNRIAQEELDTAAKALEKATEDFENAQSDLNDFRSLNGVNNVNVELQQAQTALNEAELAVLEATTDVAERRAEEQVAERRDEVDRLSGLVSDFTRFNLNFETAVTQLQTATADRNRAQTVLTASSSTEVVVLSSIEEVSKVPTLIRSGLAAVVAVFVLGMLTLFVIETRNQNRAQREAEESAGHSRTAAA